MGLIQLVLVLAAVGFILYLIETYIPMSEPIRMVIRIVIVVVLILFLMRIFGVVDIPIGR